MTPFHCCAVFRKEDNVVMSGQSWRLRQWLLSISDALYQRVTHHPDEESLENDPPISVATSGKIDGGKPARIERPVGN